MRRDDAVADGLGLQGVGHRHSGVGGVLDRPASRLAQVRGDLVGEHLDQAEAEEMGSIPAVGKRHHVSSVTCRAARATVARRAAVREPGAERAHGRDVAGRVEVDARTLALGGRELALEELTAADGWSARDRAR